MIKEDCFYLREENLKQKNFPWFLRFCKSTPDDDDRFWSKHEAFEGNNSVVLEKPVSMLSFNIIMSRNMQYGT
jgi:hypothetical protein